ncbi:MAG: spermidine synthase, partial [Planctomycetota bacterium]
MTRHLYLLFFLSGVSGLIYEAIWSRYLRLFVGSAATAQVLVLALFMGGMSLGALLVGRRSAKIRRPVLVYAIIEGLIGLYAVAFPWLYELVTRLCYDTLFPAMAGGAGVTITKWALAGGLILPACILLGMTFPLMSVGILRRAPQRSGEILSLLYFTNSFGASLGAMLAGFLLVPLVGLPNTLLAAAALNLLIFAVLLRERRVDAPLDEESAPAAASQSPLAGNRLLLPILLLTAFGTGMSSFMYEIGWIRMLSMILGSATHSFEVMLSAFVLGLALGGLWVRKRMDRFKNPVLVLAIVQIVMGVAAVATLPLYLVANESISAVFYQPERTQVMWILFNVVRYLLCLLIMLPATFCAGMTLPLLTHVLLRSGQPEATVGRVYGVNTLGAIVGVCSAGLVLMPVIGLKNVIVTGALVDMVLAVLIVRLLVPGAKVASIRRPALPAAVATIIVAGVGFFFIRLDPMVLAASVFRSGETSLQKVREILMHEDGRTATVTVTLDETGRLYKIMTNAKPDASVIKERWPEGRPRSEGPLISIDDSTQILLGLIPAMLKPHAEEWAVIGLGSGVTSHVILASPSVKNIDIVEIEPMMAKGARLFRPANERTFSDPRSKLIYDDAKAYFASARKRYDVIVSEPSNPWVSGVSSLFSIEFYREVRRHLAPGGQLAQWIHGYEMSDALLLSVLAAIDREFQDYQVYRIGPFDWVIIASHTQPIGALDRTPLENWPLMTEHTELLGIRHIAQVHALLAANARMLRPFL